MSIFGIDPTYNIGNYYVTVTTYWHLWFDTAEGVNPVFLGHCLIHSGKEYSSYYRLPESMVKANQNCRNILVFGNDTEKNVYQVFRDVLSNAYHLWCDIHIKKNIFKKLTEFIIDKGNKQETAKEIFGWTIGDSVVEGLVERNSQDDFKNNVEESESGGTRKFRSPIHWIFQTSYATTPTQLHDSRTTCSGWARLST